MRKALLAALVLAGLAASACVVDLPGGTYDCLWSAPNGGMVVVNCQPVLNARKP